MLHYSPPRVVNFTDGRLTPVISTTLCLPVDCSLLLNYCVFPIMGPWIAPCCACTCTVHVLMWPQSYRAIWLQKARHWCNYRPVWFFTLFSTLIPFFIYKKNPCKIFTEVSHNHSVAGVDSRLHTAYRTPKLYCTIPEMEWRYICLSSLAHDPSWW